MIKKVQCLQNITQEIRIFYKKWVHTIWFWIMILGILISGTLLFETTRIFVLNSFHWAMQQKADFYLNIITIIYAFFTIKIFYANKRSADLLQKQLASQRDQWLRDSFIKRECEIIARARELFEQVEGVIHSLEMIYLSDFAFRSDLQTGRVVQFQNNNYTYYYNKLDPLCSYYHNNKAILDSCGFEEGFKYLGHYMYLVAASKNAFKTDPELKQTRCYAGWNRALFWYTFPVLMHKYLKEGQIVANPNYEKCWEEFTSEKFEEYLQFLIEARRGVNSIREIFDKIMTIDLRELVTSK